MSDEWRHLTTTALLAGRAERGGEVVALKAAGNAFVTSPVELAVHGAVVAAGATEVVSTDHL